jgi:hypothetical protein
MKTAIIKPCNGTKPDQTKCDVAALPGSEFCFFHDPSKAEERRQAQAQGGRNNRMKTLNESAPDVTIEDSGDTIALLSATINQVRKGQIDPKVANAIGYLANILMKATERDILEKRIDQLEVLLREKPPTLDLSVTGTEK